MFKLYKTFFINSSFKRALWKKSFSLIFLSIKLNYKYVQKKYKTFYITEKYTKKVTTSKDYLSLFCVK